ncbi:methionine--tRNA ligase, cytoplasmic isoform X1 [Maniola jurtina]|uniref:methionine--tRNA ligase, cytoplasmic isoform X1 n=1 Tax=Maniola jurtina TaxID=191418 RepID=UPI001E68DA21|nr:methionine--tRNA ligase, cytoplasmic isoform X1 [Maniola jurtina]
MKVYTNQNNTATLKLLISGKLAGKTLVIHKATLEDDVFPGPRVLPLLEVDADLTFFSSNAATQYLFPDSSENGQCNQILEWEATRLQPVVAAVLMGKSVPSDLKQALNSLLLVIEGMLAKKKYIIGDKLSAADISIWSTLYPLTHKDTLKQSYLSEFTNITKWAQEFAQAEAVQEALNQWEGTVDGPFSSNSALGVPQITNMVSPIGSPDESPELTVTPEEIETAKENLLNGIKNLPEPLKLETPILPVKGRKNVLITSALPYVNNVPHLGNIIGCVLSADIFSRYCRLCSYNTLFVCGTDEYGTATETKALEEGITPREICDKYFAIHDSVYRWFDIGFDYFGRTSTKQQTEIAQRMFLKLMDNGFVSNQSVDQLFCENCQRFLADRFVEGTCPHPGCLYDSARGDQCDKCGKLINAIELIEPRCKVCAHRPSARPSDHLFIELGQLEPSIRTWFNNTESGWSPPARAVTRAWLRDSLRARALTRDLKWGVPVPVPGYTNKVFYVWFDAPIGYLSITQCATLNYEKWWKRDKDYDIKLYQFMAKDNVPFHGIMFPATIIGVNEGYALVDHIFATEYLNYEEGKFSKSRGVGVFGTDAQETGIPADVWRFYLASIRPETSDSSFSWTELGTRNNSELLNNLGNFCHRSLSFCANTFKGVVPEMSLTNADYEVIALVNREVSAYVQQIEKGRLREGLRHVLSISRIGNQHMQSTQPWVLLKGTDEDKVAGATAIALCCQLVSLLCTLLSPYMPATCQRLRAQLNIDGEKLRINPQNPSLIQYLPSGHVIGKPEPLFSKIEPEVLDKLRAKYAGTQSERANKQNGEVLQSTTAELEAAIAAQGEKVRNLKSTTKDKTIWQPEVDKLLALKKQLTSLPKQQNTTSDNKVSVASVVELEKAVAEQGEKVRKLKSSTKDKAVWQPEVTKLLALKKQLADAQAQAKNSVANVTSDNTSTNLEKAIAEQGDKVRKLKASTKDKSVWQPEVNILLDLKKQLAALQVNK